MKKRNVDAESHLLTGGLITGFLTCMGFLPGAATGAAVTGVLVNKDIQKANKQEMFKRDFEENQVKKQQFYKDWEEVEGILDSLANYAFKPESDDFKLQEKLENAFKGAVTIEDKITYQKVTLEKLLKTALSTSKENKIVILYGLFSPKKPCDYIIKTENGNIGYYHQGKQPYNFRQKCQKLNVPFKPVGSAELNELKIKKKYEMFEPYRMDYSKYQ